MHPPRMPSADFPPSRSPERANVTVREVAQAAGVSMITVSRAINTPQQVSPAGSDHAPGGDEHEPEREQVELAGRARADEEADPGARPERGRHPPALVVEDREPAAEHERGQEQVVVGGRRLPEDLGGEDHDQRRERADCPSEPVAAMPEPGRDHGSDAEIEEPTGVGSMEEMRRNLDELQEPEVGRVGVIDEELEVDPAAAMLVERPLTNSAGGEISLLGGSLSADGITNEAGAEINGTGAIQADLINNGDMVVIADLLIVGNLVNNGTIMIQNGIMTVTGDVTGGGVIIGGGGG